MMRLREWALGRSPAEVERYVRDLQWRIAKVGGGVTVYMTIPDVDADRICDLGGRALPVDADTNGGVCSSHQTVSK